MKTVLLLLEREQSIPDRREAVRDFFVIVDRFTVSRFQVMQPATGEPFSCSLATAAILLVALVGCGGDERPDAVSRLGDGGSASDGSAQGETVKAATDAVATGAKVTAANSSASRSVGQARFTEVAGDVGLEHVYRNGEAGRLLMVEAIGGGAGWLDYDADGRPDLYLGQGGDPTRSGEADQPSDRLWRQTPAGRFEDVSMEAGIVEPYYGQGVSVADFDADGFDDIYVTNVGRNTLWKNQGDGTFVDVTVAAGVSDPRWSSSAAWGDLDGDGDLDLYVANYCDYDVRHPRPCDKNGQPHICYPLDVPAAPDECFINQGNGSFTAEAAQRGLAVEPGRGLAVALADLDNDGDVDIYVANDMSANFLFVNEGAGRFRESAVVMGCAFDRNGAAQASMGVACGDYDGNGALDLYCTHFHQDFNTLYQNLGSSGMRDVTSLVGLVAPTLPFLGFGTVMQDFDRDGRQELLVANGHIERIVVRGQTVFEMTPQLFAYDGKRFQETTAGAGDFFQERRLGRGVATADYDGDGDLDVCIVNQNAPVALLRNDSPPARGVAFRFRGRGLNRRGVGVRVTVECGGRWMQEIAGGTSFASAHDPLLVFGLGPAASTTDAPHTVRATIRWPGGATEVLDELPLGQTHWLWEPTGDSNARTQ